MRDVLANSSLILKTHKKVMSLTFHQITKHTNTLNDDKKFEMTYDSPFEVQHRYILKILITIILFNWPIVYIVLVVLIKFTVNDEIYINDRKS